MGIWKRDTSEQKPPPPSRNSSSIPNNNNILVDYHGSLVPNYLITRPCSPCNRCECLGGFSGKHCEAQDQWTTSIPDEEKSSDGVTTPVITTVEGSTRETTTDPSGESGVTGGTKDVTEAKQTTTTSQETGEKTEDAIEVTVAPVTKVTEPSEEAITEVTVTEEAVTEVTVTEEAVTEEAVTEEAVTEKAVTEECWACVEADNGKVMGQQLKHNTALHCTK